MRVKELWTQIDKEYYAIFVILITVWQGTSPSVCQSITQTGSFDLNENWQIDVSSVIPNICQCFSWVIWKIGARCGPKSVFRSLVFFSSSSFSFILRVKLSQIIQIWNTNWKRKTTQDNNEFHVSAKYESRSSVVFLCKVFSSDSSQTYIVIKPI